MRLAYVTSEREHWISAAGGLIGILAMLWTSHALLGEHAGLFAVASMGASAVLLFAAPHGALSQPWPVLGGHLISAAIGVACAQLVPDPLIAASLAVALAIAAMYATRCLHPPGGATAFFAVMGGEPILALGWHYLFVPVLLNVVLLLIVAVIFNYPFAWRRYPQAWWQEACGCDPDDAACEAPGEKCLIPHSALVYALSQIDTFVDVSEEDLQRIYALALDAQGDAQVSGHSINSYAGALGGK